MKKFFIFVLSFIPFMLAAAIGPNVSITENGEILKWEEGAWDYFIMHKTMLSLVTGAANTAPGNPQGDTCIDPNVGSTYTLTSNHVPIDANIDKAFLVWIAGQNPDNLNGTTDNSVTLTFTNATNPNVTLSREITSSVLGTIAVNQLGSFEYEALNMPDAQTGNTGVYTYRVDISDFMKEIVALGEQEGMEPGEAIYGDYNVKDMECSNHQNYIATSGLVAAWALPFVYTSSNITAKKIYIYHGLEAYRFTSGIISVSGFELPNEAAIKLGLIVAEGDPGLASAMNLAFSPAEPEALAISGQNAVPGDFVLLQNECNPPKFTPLNYIEIYNSISSIYDWDSEFPTCIGDPINPMNPENPIEYAIDADVFLIDAKNPPFDSHLKKGDTQFNLKIGANQDQVYTNMLIISVDTKTPKFDIPINPQTPDGREKSYCSCSTDKDAVCFDRPFYYLIKVQNWGENVAFDVNLQDTLPATLDYVAGTTEIATKFDSNGLGTDWKSVEDVDGGFPFASSVKIADALDYCDKITQECKEGIMIRFVVQPKSNLAKHEVIKNTAAISDETGVVYNSNSNIPLRLKGGNCPPVTECHLPPKTECGGVAIDNPNYCESDADCPKGKKCVDNECAADISGEMTVGASVSFDVGHNSPALDNNETTIISSPNNDLVLGQFYLLSEGETGKYYNFNALTIKLTTDPDIAISNFRLFKDTNGDGAVDEGDALIAETAELATSYYINLSILDPTHRLTASGVKNYFLIVADAKMTSENGTNKKFHIEIENKESFNVSDDGEAVVKGKKIEFATFKFEPNKGFIFTKGKKDPKIPSYKEFNGEHPVLQIRTKAKGAEDKIKSMTIKAPGGHAKFGEGLKSLKILVDKDGDGTESPGDQLVRTISEFSSGGSLTINNLENDLVYNQDEEKYLLIKLDFNLSQGQTAKISVTKVKVSSGSEIYELPVSSKVFTYEYDPTEPTQGVVESEESGCSLSLIQNSNFGYKSLILLLFLLPFAFAAFKKE